MGTKLSEICCKEVICLETGQRLGYVSDAVIRLPEGEVAALVVPGPGRCLGLLESREDFIIPFSSVKKIGPDIILTDCRPNDCRKPKKKRQDKLNWAP
jgi:YlmC/YmxH family sporulation protein